MKTPNNQVSRILVTRTDRIGDLVLSTPVFQALRRKFPDAWIAGLCFLEHHEILEGNPYLDEVILYDKQGSQRGIFGNLKFALKIASKKFDVVIHLHATNRMHWMGWLAGIPRRIGWDRRSSWTLTECFADVKKSGLKHEAEYNFDLLEPLGISVPETLTLHFPCQERAERSLGELLFHLGISESRPRVVLSPGASCPSKRWPPARFAQVAERIAAEYPVSLFTIGSRADRPVVQEMIEQCSAPLCDLSGKLNLSMLGVLLKNAALLVSNDSGPVHIASAFETPVLSLFGRNDPGLSPIRWRPLGKGARFLWRPEKCGVCLARDCERHFGCLNSITVEEVLREAVALLVRNKNAREGRS